jgi:ATP-binding cassette subfamily C protein
MRREIRFGLASVRRRPMLMLVGWSIPEALPTALSGVIVARALDDGFLAGRPDVGLLWLSGFMAAAMVSAVGSRQLYRVLGGLVEPFRDVLVRRVVAGALRRAAAGGQDDGAVSRINRQVEVVRDAYAGLLVVVLGFVVTAVGVVVGLTALDPAMAALIVPPFFVGIGLFVAMLGMAAAREKAAISADERLAETVGSVLAGTRDVVAGGAEERAAAMMAAPISDQAAAERALARVEVLRTLCFVVGGWLPLLVLLTAGPWLVGRGLTAGAIMGGLTYVLFGLQPGLQTVIGGVGSSGLRFVVTLGRILDASTPPDVPSRRTDPPGDFAVAFHGITFAYGPHSEPVLRDLDLFVPEDDHLAIVGPSGIGKSTLAGVLCGLLEPTAGHVRIGGVPADELPADSRVLIPQEAYVFSGTVWANLTYLRQTATAEEVNTAVSVIGAGELVARLGGYTALVLPDQLSAGERQLISLVRAYLSPASVVVLDEATCHLDAFAERRAEAAFGVRGGTLIVIAHRVSSALRARRILVLDGKSAIAGDHRTLWAESPLYRELLGHWDVRPTSPAEDGDRAVLA